MNHHLISTAILSAAVLAAACGGAPQAPQEAVPAGADQGLAECRHDADPDHDRGPLRVMTRNLYLGADITPLSTAATTVDAIQAATRAWHTVQMTRFPARAQVLADEIREARPDVLGLQEVTTWRLGEVDGCAAFDPNRTTATRVAYDFLEILQRALRERGLHYEVAAQVSTMDVQVCIGQPDVPATLRALRYTDRDVLLVRHGLEWRAPVLPPLPPPPIPPAPGDRNGGVYAITLEDGTPATACFPIAGSAPACSFRGWTALEARKGGHWVRVFETHLEDWLPTPEGVPPWIFQAFQAAQLVGIVDALYLDEASRLPTLAIGDFNAYATPDDQPPVYGFLIGGGFLLDPSLDGASPFADAWTTHRPDDPGFTWGFDELLYTGKLTTRLDLVLATPELVPGAIRRVGVHDRTRTGQHPSDHAGLTATFPLH